MAILVTALQFITADLAGQASFHAYHTKLSHTSTDYFGKYADLIVVLGEGKQLEFTRRTQYRPRWVTPNGSFMVDDFFPERDPDHHLEYSHVRLIEEGKERIMVHWRYFPDLSVIERINDELEPTAIEGITSVVHELFTIFPDGNVERVVKDARGSFYESWITPDFGHRQTLQLTDSGIVHGPVEWGRRLPVLSELIDKNPVIEPGGIAEPLLNWKFDEGGDGFPFEVEEEEIWEFAHYVWEWETEEFCPISGHMALFKNGVSGTSLGFDGYYTGVVFDEETPETEDALSMEAWLALDMYPFNEAPVLHRSEEFGDKGFYLGVDAYGKLLLRVNGEEARSAGTLPLYRWTHVAATLNSQTAALYLDGENVGQFTFEGDFNDAESDYTLGINNTPQRCTDPVRGPDQNLPFIYGIQGLLDEVRVYDMALSEEQVQKHYQAFLPADRTSPLKKAILPGEVGIAEQFGAEYKNLEYHELWDRMWRPTEHTDIVVKFDHSPVSVVYWRGTNFAANWVTDNNRWMADQSSEIFTTHGCAEHMADKQTRHSYARIIENNDARVIIHWRYPCVDVGYVCIDRMNYTDEYHTIYPDATAIRKVVYNNTTTGAPGFQDIQYFTNPGETALDVIDLHAVTLANTDGETYEMVWKKPNRNPRSRLENATIQYMNTHSNWKVYALYPEPGIGTWGQYEQSKYTDDPFAGPWNHWPISLVPSDGRFAVAHDRVTHFALGAGDAGEEAVVQYGFTDKNIGTLAPAARYWQKPPSVTGVSGGEFLGFDRGEKAYHFKSHSGPYLHFYLEATEQSPVVNPALVIHNCRAEQIEIVINGQPVRSGKEMRIGKEYDTDGRPMAILWIERVSTDPLEIDLTFNGIWQPPASPGPPG